MNKKGLAILMRTRMRPTNDSPHLARSPLANMVNQTVNGTPSSSGTQKLNASSNTKRDFEVVSESMHSAISMSKTEVLDSVLSDFSAGYFSLCYENRRKLLVQLAKEYDLNRTQVRDLIKQYLGLELPGTGSDNADSEEKASLSAFYRIERNLSHALKPMYELISYQFSQKDNLASLRALDSYLKEKLSTWLSPAALELHQITWDDPASLLEKIVAYEAVHPISNLIDLKRR
ncbi:hypothetical protein ACLB2K_033275 [Fragaria x ananassa]